MKLHAGLLEELCEGCQEWVPGVEMVSDGTTLLALCYACVPKIKALTALQGLRSRGKVEAGQRLEEGGKG